MIKSKDFLQVADRLIAATTEADWRSAISRAYYAAFHVAIDVLTACGFSVPNGDRAHAYLWLRLSNAGVQAVREAGKDLSALRTSRNFADYELRRSISQTIASLRVQNAKDIIHSLESALASPVIKKQITDAMKIYERDVLQDVTWHP